MHSNHWIVIYIPLNVQQALFVKHIFIKESSLCILLLCNPYLLTAFQFMVFKIQRRDAFLFVLFGCLFTDVVCFCIKVKNTQIFTNISNLKNFVFFVLIVLSMANSIIFVIFFSFPQHSGNFSVEFLPLKITDVKFYQINMRN